MSQTITRKAPLDACTLSLDDMKNLYQKLSRSIVEASEFERKKWTPPQDENKLDDFNSFIKQRCDAYQITVVINGARGETLVDRNDSVFASPNLPENITSIYFTSTSMYETAFNYKPAHFFILNIDFNKPPLIDFSTSPSIATPNGSFIEIAGESENWVAGVFEIVKSKVQAKDNKRAWLHKALVYDAVLWFIVFPLAFYVCYSVEGVVQHKIDYRYVKIGLIFYSFFLVINLYRMFFSYTKWAFPKMELAARYSTTAMHRKWWFAISTGMVVCILWNVLARLF